MGAVWISKESWDLVWNALHNIQVRMSRGVHTPYAAVTGSGSAARIQIDLPGAADGESQNRTQFSCRAVVNGDGTRSIEVYDGTDPDSEYCGSMLDRDRGTVLKRIEKTMLTLPDCTTSGTVHLLLLDYVPTAENVYYGRGKSLRAVRIVFVPSGSYLLLNQNNVDIELAFVFNTEQVFTVTQDLERFPFTVSYPSLMSQMYANGFYCRFVEDMVTPDTREVHVEVVSNPYLTREMLGGKDQSGVNTSERPTLAGKWRGHEVQARTFSIPVDGVSDFLESSGSISLVLDIHNITAPSVYLLDAETISGAGYRMYEPSFSNSNTWSSGGYWPEKILILPLARISGRFLHMESYLPYGIRRIDCDSSIPDFFNLTDFLDSEWRIEPQYTVTEKKQGRSVCYEKSSETDWKVRCPSKSYAGRFSFSSHGDVHLEVPETTFTAEWSNVRLYAYLTYSEDSYQAGLCYRFPDGHLDFGDGPERDLDENATFFASIRNGYDVLYTSDIKVTDLWL